MDHLSVILDGFLIRSHESLTLLETLSTEVMAELFKEAGSENLDETSDDKPV